MKKPNKNFNNDKKFNNENKNKLKSLYENYSKNYDNFSKNYETLFQELKKKNINDIANYTYSSVIGAKKILILDFFNEKILISFKDSKIYKIKEYDEKIVYNTNYNAVYNAVGNYDVLDNYTSSIILHFLINAAKIPLSGLWISYRELPDGLFYASTIPSVILPLAKRYENNGEEFINKIVSLGGVRENNFKFGGVILPFKKFPILFVLEEKDQEFDSDIKVFFDKNSHLFMKSDIIKTLLVYTVKKILN